jgi:hypothetical protein
MTHRQVPKTPHFTMFRLAAEEDTAREAQALESQKRLERGAEQLEGSADSECIANAASVRDLLASLVFTEDSSLSAGAQPR